MVVVGATEAVAREAVVVCMDALVLMGGRADAWGAEGPAVEPGR